MMCFEVVSQVMLNPFDPVHVRYAHVQLVCKRLPWLRKTANVTIPPVIVIVCRVIDQL